MRTALTIAGSDSGGGAGIQADLKTFAALGVFGTTAITAITAQNTLGVSRVFALPPDLVAAQIDAVASDLAPAATKIGMLANAGIARVVAASLSRHALPHVVLDTVMVAKGGARLLEDEAVEVLRRELLGRADIVTANMPEAEALTGLTLTSVEDLRRAAARLVADGARAVVVKGGHLAGAAVDIFHDGRLFEDLRRAAARLVADGARAVVVKGGHLAGAAVDIFHDGRLFEELRSERIETRHTHGTGCTFAAAIAARLALDDTMLDAVRAAKAYVTRAIAQAPGLGAGHGPLRH